MISGLGKTSVWDLWKPLPGRIDSAGLYTIRQLNRRIKEVFAKLYSILQEIISEFARHFLVHFLCITCEKHFFFVMRLQDFFVILCTFKIYSPGCQERRREVVEPYSCKCVKPQPENSRMCFQLIQGMSPNCIMHICNFRFRPGISIQRELKHKYTWNLWDLLLLALHLTGPEGPMISFHISQLHIF